MVFLGSMRFIQEKFSRVFPGTSDSDGEIYSIYNSVLLMKWLPAM